MGKVYGKGKQLLKKSKTNYEKNDLNLDLSDII